LRGEVTNTQPWFLRLDAPASDPTSGVTPHRVGGGPVGTPLTSSKCPEVKDCMCWCLWEISPSSTSPLPPYLIFALFINLLCLPSLVPIPIFPAGTPHRGQSPPLLLGSIEGATRTRETTTTPTSTSCGGGVQLRQTTARATRTTAARTPTSPSPTWPPREGPGLWTGGHRRRGKWGEQGFEVPCHRVRGARP
jgi:hypothetical protein